MREEAFIPLVRKKILEHYWDEIHAVPELSKGPDRSKVANCFACNVAPTSRYLAN
jgi:hypothetical protein